MPTYGWILEDALDRAWWPAAVFCCHTCGAQFDSGEKLREHYGSEHPIEMPVLYVQGADLGREPVIRSLDRSLGVTALQTTRCHAAVDGGAFGILAVDDIENFLIRHPNSTILLRLSNRRSLDGADVTREYKLRMRVPDEKALVDVDQLFAEVLARDLLSHTDVARYERSMPTGVAEREYAAALGDYAVGVLIKQSTASPHAGTGFAEFEVKMKGALWVLSGFNRPMALAVGNAIRFNLNGLTRRVEHALTPLDTALDRMAAWVSSGEPVPACGPGRSGDMEAVLPVDEVTALLVRAVSELDEYGLASPLRRDVDAIGADGPASEHDLLKARAILGESFHASGDLARARREFERLQFDPTFRNWAERRLEAIRDQEG